MPRNKRLGKSSEKARKKLGKGYELFLGLPVPLVLAVFWFLGALALYVLWLFLKLTAGA